MKIPISRRLLCCAELTPPCGTVADVGTDHGYLGIYLLQSGKCAHVIAADLREKPLASARANAAEFCVSGQMSFILSDGLHNIEPGAFDTLVLAGMGGDLITRILAEAPWLEGGPYTLILQPQSAANDLRRWLGERGWSIRRERLVRDGRFLYAVMEVRPGEGRALSPGEQYVSPALRRAGDPLYPEFLARVRRALELTVAGITQSADPADLERAEYYRAALEEVAAI
ncbi:MAG: SAM-dependent methyltransferase [Oscillospiraceae bacterium]|nr:SAM-dependent methyltransferase [Oscillospiraceae bacterium]